MKLNIFFFTVLLFLCQAATAQRDSIGKVLDIGNNSDYEGYDMLDSLLAIKRVFIAGEDYNYAAFNSKLEFKLLRYMNYKAGLRNYLVETSPAKADLINQYISSEDSAVEKLLQSVSKVKYMRLYKNLKRLNRQLPDSLKIRVHGVDVERSNALPVVKMSQYLPEENIPDALRISVEAIEGAAKYIITKGLEEYDKEKEGEASDYEDYYYRPSAFSVSQSLQEFIKNYDSLKDEFENWLGDTFVNFNNAVNWLKEYKDYNRYNMTAMEFTWREEMIFNRVNELLAANPDEKFFGQFGRCRSSYAKVSQGCGINNFSGLVHKLKNYPDSYGKDVVSFGIFYYDELDDGDEYEDKQQAQYKDDLGRLFETFPEDEVAIADPMEFDSLGSIAKDFSLLILNKGYVIDDDSETEVDSTTEYESGGWEWDSEAGYRNSRIYTGVHMYNPIIKYNEMNAELKNAGLDTVVGSGYINGELAIASESGIASLFYSTSLAANANYKSSVIGLKGGNCFVFKRFLKVGLFTTWSYVRHQITQNSNVTDLTYFVDYAPPKVFVNPSVILGISADVYVDLAPFYIYGCGGRQWDVGRSNWRSDGHATGNLGGLSNTSWFTNLGLGLSIPLRWID